ncbi:MAG: 16S rRNA (cytidine(1402)-2'-O)-methyltransferase [Parvularculaceae bacterium]|nr:16S rRNA (cytidine(1402)-2'-O)-methyltransferase [Parvularculaceae bacterium]
MKTLPPGLHVAATPIGNLGDVSDRLRQALEQADRILCEDTRVTGKLISALGLIKQPLTAYHEHSASELRPRIIAELEDGGRIVLVSDAGTPLISDPGYKIVRDARDAGIKVFSIAGPSALTAALSIAGAPTDRFSFLGFMPRADGQRATLLRSVMSRAETLAFYETGPRISASLAAVAEVLGNRTVSVARELTKLHEEVIEGEAAELSSRFADHPPKGEMVVLIHPGQAEALDLDQVLTDLLATKSVREASKEAAELTGLAKKDCYARALELKETTG